MNPFRALYGKDPRTLFKVEDSPSAIEEVNEQLKAPNLVLFELKENLEKAHPYESPGKPKKERYQFWGWRHGFSYITTI